ncbi:MAG: hypothetical protein ACTSU7_00285 [Candidatus Heimdallarchaeaceae archaeon]
MAVRNINAIGGNKPIPVIHFIPPRFSPIYKIEIITDTETIDLTDFLVKGEYTDGITDSIGSFNMQFLDPVNNIIGRVEEFDTIKIYLDYGKVATTLRFTGKIEKLSNSNQIYLDLVGRSIAMITSGVNVTYSSNGEKSRSVILTEIIEKYFSGEISTSGIEIDAGTKNVNYAEIPFWEVVSDICNAAFYDAYISPTQVFNYFVRGSRTNETEAIVENMNLIKSPEYGKNTQEIYTKVRVYGSEAGNVPIIYSSESDTTNTKGIVKELKLDNGSVVTPSQGKNLADFKFDSIKTAPTLGTVLSLMLPTIAPGEKIAIANPINNIPPANYEINTFRQIFSNTQAPQTEVVISKQKLDFAQVIKRNIQFQTHVTTNPNPEEMDYTLVFDYDVVGEKLFTEGTFSDTELEINETTGKGVIKVSTGETGSWLSEVIQLEGVPAAIELRENSTDLAGTKFFVSANGGLNFRELKADGGSFEFDNPQASLQLRMDLKSSTTRIEKVGIYYKI